MNQKSQNKIKFTLPSIILIIMFFITITFLITIKYTKYQSLVRLENNIVLSTKLSKLLHVTQIERGLSVGFLGTSGKKFKEVLDARRVETDKEITELTKFIKNNQKAYTFTTIKITLEKVLQQLSKIKMMRYSISTFSISKNNMLFYYSNINKQILKIIIEISKMSNFSNMAQNIIAYSNFLYSKENAGIERAIGTAILSDKIINQITINQFNSNIEKELLRREIFLQYASEDARIYYYNYFKGKEIDDVSIMNEIILSGKIDEIKKINIINWFTDSTKKVDILKMIDDYLAKQINMKIQTELQDTKMNLFLFILFGFISFLIFMFMIHLILKLIANESRLKSLIDKYIISSTTDIKGMITDASVAFCKIAGYDKSELIGKPHNIIRDPSMPKEVFKNMWSTIQQGKTWKGQVKNRKKLEGYYWVDANIEPMFDRHGNIEAYIAIRLDITDKIALEKEIEKNRKQNIDLQHQTYLAKESSKELICVNKKLELARLKAEDNTKLKSDFLANMSHEIRTPMNGILGMTHLALKTNLSDKQKDYIQKIDYSAKSLLGIINDILDFSKIEAGKLTIEKIEFDLPELITNIIHLVEIKAYEKNLAIVINYDIKTDKHYFGDSLRIGQIITNLLGNAVKFTECGEVGLYIKRVNSKTFKFSITDTGIGLTTKQQAKLFQSFTQADGSTSREYGGTGLGLSISKQLVELMGGKIWVESTPEKGSVFSFEIPLKEIESSTQEKEYKKNEVSLEDEITKLKGSKILLIEDNLINQEIIVGLLQHSGIFIDMANNGQEAVDMFHLNKYELILTDLQMPIMNGFEVSKHIREIDPNIPIIALTANVMKEDIEKTKKAGMNDHLNKPIEVNKLYAMLLKYLSIKEDKYHNVSKKPILIIPTFNAIDVEIGLQFMANDRELYLEILRVFRKNYEHFELDTLDGEAFELAIHTIQGVSQTIGAMELYSISKEIDKNQDKTLIPRFNKVLKSVINELISAEL